MLIDAAVFVRDHQPMTKKNECGRLSSLARVSRSHGSARDAVEAYLVRVCSMLSRISVTSVSYTHLTLPTIYSV